MYVHTIYIHIGQYMSFGGPVVAIFLLMCVCVYSYVYVYVGGSAMSLFLHMYIRIDIYICIRRWKRDISLFAFPMDWRLGPPSYSNPAGDHMRMSVCVCVCLCVF